MKSQYRDAFAVAAVVVVAVGIGLGVFLYSGSTAAVVFFGIGIPTLLGIGGLIHKRRVSSSEGSESPKLASMTRDLTSEFESLLSTYERVSTEESWDPETLEKRIRDVGKELENRGLAIDQTGDGYRVNVERVDMGPGAINRYMQRVNSLREELLDSYREGVEQQTNEMNRQLKRLSSAGLLAGGVSVGDESGARLVSVEEIRSASAERHEEFLNRVWNAIDVVRQAEDVGVDANRVESAIESNQYEKAVDTVLGARQRIEETEREPFENDRDTLINLIETVESSAAITHVPQPRRDKLSEISSEVRSLDSVLERDKLETARRDMLNLCKNIVTDLDTRLRNVIDEFSRESVPPDYYERPSVRKRDVVEELERADTLEKFRTKWSNIAAELVDAVEHAEILEGALTAYPDVAEDIGRTLAEVDEVTTADVPFSPAPPVMRLYAARTSDVTYLENKQVLTPDAVGQRHDLTVWVQLDSEESEAITVRVDGQSFSGQQSETVAGSESFVFESVPEGQVVVTATPETVQFTEAKLELLLKEDQTVELSLSEATPRAQVCEGIEEETKLLLDEVEGELDVQFDDASMLDSQMDLGVREEYAPCLLALWAERRSAEVWIGEIVVVYDSDVLTDQLESAIKGETSDSAPLSYDDIRDHVMTANIPDGFIEERLKNITDDEPFEVADEGVVKRG